MMRRASSLDDLASDVVTVLRALAILMNGKPVEPKIVDEAFRQIGNVLPGHSFMLHHVPRSPKPAKPRTLVLPHYVLTIAGSRTDGRWSFRPGKLEELLNALAPDAQPSP